MPTKLSFPVVFFMVCGFLLSTLSATFLARFFGAPAYTDPLFARIESGLGYDTYISPTNYGDAAFDYSGGFLDTVITLQVHDYTAPKSGQRIVDLGLVSDIGGQGIWPKKAYWTGDGSVFVVEETGAMYDFKDHSTKPPKQFITGTKKNGYPSYDFKKFIESRGGQGPNVLKGK